MKLALKVDQPQTVGTTDKKYQHLQKHRMYRSITQPKIYTEHQQRNI